VVYCRVQRKGELVTFVDSSKIAQKIINIFSDNRATDADWYFNVPLHAVQTALPVVINIRNFCKGMERNMQIYNIVIPDEKLFPPRELFGDLPTLEDWGFYDQIDVDRLLDQTNQERGDVNPGGLG
jgi:hypothetical protein